MITVKSLPVIGLFVRQIFNITNIAPLQTFPSSLNTPRPLPEGAEYVGDSRDFKCAHVHRAVTEQYFYITDNVYILFLFYSVVTGLMFAGCSVKFL
jgi:hypothetical protein